VAEVLVAAVLVALFAGGLVGRNREKSRRSFVDRAAAKATYDKSRQVVWEQIWRLVVTYVFVGSFVVAFIWAWLSAHS